MTLSFGVYVMCRDRLDYLQDLTRSIKNNIDHGFSIKFYISDNSKHESNTQKIKELYHSEFVILERGGFLTSYQHYWTIIREAKEDFICILHDDDIIAHDFLKTICEFISKNRHVTAVAFNSCSFRHAQEIYSISQIMYAKREVNYKNMVKKYLTQQSVLAVSGYFYNSRLLQDLEAAEYEGIYMDAALIIHLAQKYGNVFWLPQVKLFSRVHGNNESFSENTMQRRKLIRLLAVDNLLSKKDVMAKYYLSLSVIRQKNQDGPLILLQGLMSRRLFLISKLIYIVPGNIASKLLKRVYAFVFLRNINKKIFK